ncbi:hypothetical protein GW17_00048362 [Ensete ventricosum]|nr:hypothetical protein GW17_00048362 [Ensete ventricosum]
MLSLSFPTVVSKLRLFVRKIDFKLRAMRLNHVELFYAFLLCFHNEGSKEGGSHLRIGPLQGRCSSIRATPTHPRAGAPAHEQKRPAAMRSTTAYTEAAATTTVGKGQRA